MTDVFTAEKTARILGQQKGFEYGVPFLNDALRKIMPGELNVLGARTGRGKTGLASHIALSVGGDQRRVVFFALEADYGEIHRRLLYREIMDLVRRLYPSLVKLMPRYRDWRVEGFRSLEADTAFDVAIEDRAEENLRRKMAFIEVRYMPHSVTPRQFIELLREETQETALRDKAELVILDHLHYFAFDGGSETESLQRAVHELKAVATDSQVPMLVISHLRKGSRGDTRAMPTLDDFHGHSDIVKVASNVIVMAPESATSDGKSFFTLFQIPKSREAGEVTPYIARHSYSFSHNAYSPTYELFTEGSDGLTAVSRMNFPSWATNASRVGDA